MNVHVVVWLQPLVVPAEPVRYHWPVVVASRYGLHSSTVAPGAGCHTTDEEFDGFPVRFGSISNVMFS